MHSKRWLYPRLETNIWFPSWISALASSLAYFCLSEQSLWEQERDGKGLYGGLQFAPSIWRNETLWTVCGLCDLHWRLPVLHHIAGTPAQRLWGKQLVTGVSGEKLVKPEPKLAGKQGDNSSGLWLSAHQAKERAKVGTWAPLGYMIKHHPLSLSPPCTRHWRSSPRRQKNRCVNRRWGPNPPHLQAC